MKSNLQRERRSAATFRQWFEFLMLRILVGMLRLLPRRFARAVGAGLAWCSYLLIPRLRSVGLRNLSIAYPGWTAGRRQQVLRCEYKRLGWLIAEFCLMSTYSLQYASSFIEYDGLAHYLAARDRGKGVLVLTGHLGAWELSSFFHSLAGYPMGLVIRRLDNPLVDEFVNQIRCLHGNRVLHKDDFARGLISAMRDGETVGILMDTNMTPPQGVFVPFFGLDACTASGLARIALKTDAAVLPGFLLWDEGKRKYVLRFGECLHLIRTGDGDADVVDNTAAFNLVIERYVRTAPDQWLWMHRRWKTRPAGERGVY